MESIEIEEALVHITRMRPVVHLCYVEWLADLRETLRVPYRRILQPGFKTEDGLLSQFAIGWDIISISDIQTAILGKVNDINDNRRDWLMNQATEAEFTSQREGLQYQFTRAVVKLTFRHSWPTTIVAPRLFDSLKFFLRQTLWEAFDVLKEMDRPEAGIAVDSGDSSSD